MGLNDCYNFEDFRKLAKKKLPAPIFHYIDGGADDEVTLNRNTDAFNDCDLVPNILNSVGEPDLSTTVFGRKISMPLFLSPTAMQSLYDPEGDKASARAAEKLVCHYFYHPQQCKVCMIQKGIKLLQEQLKNLILFIACLPWHLFQLRKLQIYQVVLNSFNFIFIKISQLQMI